MGKKILLTYGNFSSFVRKDYEILSERFTVSRFRFRPEKRLFPFAFQFLRQLFFLLFKGWKYDVFLIWFADYHSLLPVIFARLFQKKSYIVAGGYDATSIPQLQYGLFYKNDFRHFAGKKSFENCTMILPVDESLIEYTNTYAFEEPLATGIKRFCKVPEANFRTIPTGYDLQFWKVKKEVKRANSILSVAAVSDLSRWKLKGGDFLMEVARLLPEYDFYFYGISDDFMSVLKRTEIPSNFHLKGAVSHSQLPEIYSGHKVYAQFSISEGLPNVLCEAMLCGCIPVGSDVNGISTAIGDTGFVLNKKDAEKAAGLIVKAVHLDDSQAPRNRIMELFDIQRRIKSFEEIF